MSRRARERVMWTHVHRLKSSAALASSRLTRVTTWRQPPSAGVIMSRSTSRSVKMTEAVMTKNPGTRHLPRSEARAGAGFELAGARRHHLSVVGEAQTVPPAGPSTRAPIRKDGGPRRGRTLSSPVKNTPTTVASMGRDLMDETPTAQPDMTRRSWSGPIVGLAAIREALRRVRAKTLGAGVLLLTIGAASTALAAAQSAPGDGGRPEVAITALEGRGVRAPQIVRGTDGRWHI